MHGHMNVKFVKKFFIMQFSPLSCYFHLGPTYLSQRCIRSIYSEV